jgi:hypothetical protein
MENQKGSVDYRMKESITPTLAPSVEEGKLRPHRQGKPGSPGDNTLGVLGVGRTHSSPSLTSSGGCVVTGDLLAWQVTIGGRVHFGGNHSPYFRVL